MQTLSSPGSPERAFDGRATCPAVAPKADTALSA